MDTHVIHVDFTYAVGTAGFVFSPSGFVFCSGTGRVWYPCGLSTTNLHSAPSCAALSPASTHLQSDSSSLTICVRDFESAWDVFSRALAPSNSFALTPATSPNVRGSPPVSSAGSIDREICVWMLAQLRAFAPSTRDHEASRVHASRVRRVREWMNQCGWHQSSSTSSSSPTHGESSHRPL